MTECPVCGAWLEHIATVQRHGLVVDEYRCTQCAFLTEVER